MDQQKYIDGLKEIDSDIERRSQLDEKLSDKEKKQLRSVCGQLLWATSQTRPDAAYESCRLSNYGKEATVRALLDANKVIRKVKSMHVKIVFPGLGDPCATNATHGASQGASIVFLSGNNRVVPISWNWRELPSLL